MVEGSWSVRLNAPNGGNLRGKALVILWYNALKKQKEMQKNARKLYVFGQIVVIATGLEDKKSLFLFDQEVT